MQKWSRMHKWHEAGVLEEDGMRADPFGWLYDLSRKAIWLWLPSASMVYVIARGALYILQGVWFLRKGPCEYTSGTEETSTTKAAHFTAATNAFARVMKSNLCVLRGLMWQFLPIISKLLSISFSHTRTSVKQYMVTHTLSVINERTRRSGVRSLVLKDGMCKCH